MPVSVTLVRGGAHRPMEGFPGTLNFDKNCGVRDRVQPLSDQKPDAFVGGSLRPRTAEEIRTILRAERTGEAFLVFRSASGAQLIRSLKDCSLVTMGRHSSCDISLSWDEKISSTHAVLECVGTAWTVADDGISRNGTYLNGARVGTRCRLVDGDVIRVGSTLVVFRRAREATIAATSTASSAVSIDVTPMQRKVLVALCRPFKHGGRYPTPASNTEIAAELVLSIDAVKTHMRGLFERFDVKDLPQNQKRAMVVELALRTGLVTERDL